MEFANDFFKSSPHVKAFGETTLHELQDRARSQAVKPCPFCGGEAVLELSQHLYIYCFIKCSSCHCRTLLFQEHSRIGWNGKEMTIFDCLAEAIKRWNRRTA